MTRLSRASAVAAPVIQLTERVPVVRRIAALLTRSHVARNTALQLASQGFSMAVSVVTFAMTSRALGSSGYGQYGLALTYSAFVGIVLDAGLDTHVVTTLAAGHERPSRDAAARRLVTDATLVRLAIGLVATCVAVAIGVAVSYPAEVIVGVAVLSGTTLLTAIAALIGDVFQSVLDVRLSVLATVVTRAAMAVAMLILFVLHALTIWTLLAATVFGAVSGLAVAVFLAFFWGFRYTIPSIARSSRLYAVTAPLAAWVILGQVVHRADAVILSLVHLNPSLGLSNTEAVGIYVAAYKFFDMANVLPGYLIVSVMPGLAARAKEMPAFRGYFRRWIGRMTLGGVLFGAVFAIVGGPVLLILSGPSFEPSAGIVLVLSIPIALAFVTTILFAGAVSLGRRKSVAWLYLVVAIANVGLNFALDGEYGYWAAAWLTAVSQAVLAVGMLWIVRDMVEST